MRNSEIADRLDELADLYALDGAVIYRIVAYREAAKTVRECMVSVEDMARAGTLTALSGIGRTLAEKIEALVTTGTIPAAERLREKHPRGLIDITRIPGLGPKRARLLFEEAGIDSIEALREAAAAGRLRRIKGFGTRAEENVLEGLRRLGDDDTARFLLPDVLAMGEEIEGRLRVAAGVERLALAGSARRMTETCHDLDLVASTHDAPRLIESFASLDLIDEVRASGASGAGAVTHTGLPVDLRVCDPPRFGNLLQHMTGSKSHSVAVRQRAVGLGLHVSENGIVDERTGETTTCRTEEQVYARLGMSWVPPELREDRGEVAAAVDGELPDLVKESDIAGDMHCHTTLSDGRNTLEEMVEAARGRGYSYIAVTDHSASHGFGDNVPEGELRKRIDRVRNMNERLGEGPEEFTVLAGTEVHILPDGSLDYPDELLAQLDWVVAAIHTSFRMSEREMTERIVSAMLNPFVDAISHPTGRLLLRREPYAVNVERLLEEARNTATMMEINANPRRRDLSEIHARAAADLGVPLVIGTDAHRADSLSFMRFGVATARRAWLTAADVANARPWDELRKMRKRERRDGAPVEA